MNGRERGARARGDRSYRFDEEFDRGGYYFNRSSKNPSKKVFTDFLFDACRAVS